MDNYQAVYDAVRSRMSNFDPSQLIDAISRNWDASYAVEAVKQDFHNVAHQMQRPSVIFKPTLSQDGNAWIALYGEDLQVGVAGLGDSPAKAMDDFDKKWFEEVES